MSSSTKFITTRQTKQSSRNTSSSTTTPTRLSIYLAGSSPMEFVFKFLSVQRWNPASTSWFHKIRTRYVPCSASIRLGPGMGRLRTAASEFGCVIETVSSSMKSITNAVSLGRRSATRLATRSNLCIPILRTTSEGIGVERKPRPARTRNWSLVARLGVICPVRNRHVVRPRLGKGQTLTTPRGRLGMHRLAMAIRMCGQHSTCEATTRRSI